MVKHKYNKEDFINDRKNEGSLPKKSTKKLMEKKSQKLDCIEIWGLDKSENPNSKEDFEDLLKEMVKPRK